MEKIHENTCKQACSYVFKQENYIKARVLMYFLQLVLTFTPHYIIMVKGLLCGYFYLVGGELRMVSQPVVLRLCCTMYTV